LLLYLALFVLFNIGSRFVVSYCLFLYYKKLRINKKNKKDVEEEMISDDNNNSDDKNKNKINICWNGEMSQWSVKLRSVN